MKINELPTPCFVIDETKLIHNLEILKEVEERTGAKILLAQKCFSCFEEYPLIGKYISGTTASGLYEARLGKEEMGLENHVYSPAYRSQDIEELVLLAELGKAGAQLGVDLLAGGGQQRIHLLEALIHVGE